MRGNYLFAMGLLACAACTSDRPDGTSTGNPLPDPDAGPRDPDDAEGGLTGSGYCQAGDKTPLGLNEDSPLGFSAADILAFSEGTHEETIRWNPYDGVAFTPESGEQTITITVTRSGEPRFVLPKAPDDGTEELLVDIEGGCMSWVEVPVDVTVETSGGALDETFEGLLRSHHPLSASVFYFTPDPEELGGDFEVATSGEWEGFTLAQLTLNVRFSPYGVGGTFNGMLEKELGDAVVGGAGGQKPYADFGAGTCGDNADGFTVGLDDEIEGATVQDALDMFGADDEVELTWETGATTTSSMTFAPTTQGGCVLLDNEITGDLTLLAQGTLSMTSADGRLDSEWSGRIEAHIADDGSISRIAYLFDGKFIEPNTPDANAQLGFPNDEIASFDAVGAGVDITVTSGGVDGAVSLTGYVYPDCAQAPDEPGSDEDPMVDPGEGGAEGSGTPGCRGADPIPLARGEIE